MMKRETDCQGTESKLPCSETIYQFLEGAVQRAGGDLRWNFLIPFNWLLQAVPHTTKQLLLDEVCAPS